MSSLCIIPARGGSKRIPRKNIKDFLGKPIIAYSVETALQSGLFDEVMVSTDDEEIADVAKRFGAKVPFMRSKKNADDFATTLDVIREVLQSYEEKSRRFDCACCIYPAAPFITTSVLQTAFDKLIKEKLFSVFPVVKYSYPIWRSLGINEGKVFMWWPENASKRSQDLPEAYHDAGQFYWMKTAGLKEKNSLFSDNTGCIVLDALHVQDIDTEEDWKLAEFKYEYLHKQ